MKFRWFITKRHLVALIGLLVACMLLMLLAGCIPVTIRPQFDAENKPIALPVTPVGSVTATGELVPIYPVSNEAPKPTNWGAIGTAVGAALSGLLAVYGINLRGAFAKAKTALAVTAQLVDQVAQCDTDADVAKAKEAANVRQIALGVHQLTQQVRGKA
jgi:hypothetical protein